MIASGIVFVNIGGRFAEMGAGPPRRGDFGAAIFFFRFATSGRF
jgi:hypothetical protein